MNKPAILVALAVSASALASEPVPAPLPAEPPLPPAFVFDDLSPSTDGFDSSLPANNGFPPFPGAPAADDSAERQRAAELRREATALALEQVRDTPQQGFGSTGNDNGYQLQQQIRTLSAYLRQSPVPKPVVTTEDAPAPMVPSPQPAEMSAPTQSGEPPDWVQALFDE